MWKALDQQNVVQRHRRRHRSRRARDLGDARRPATKIHFLSHYVYTAPKNKVNDWLVAADAQEAARCPTCSRPDGFVLAQMIVHALQKGDYNVDKMISALEGWKFLAPKGFQAIRPQDHAMLQPMFRVSLVSKDGQLVPQGARHRDAVRHGAADRADAGLGGQTTISA